MRISVTQSGGFAGANVPLADLDTAQLPQPAASRIEQAVQQANFFGQAAQAAPAAVGADLLQYNITVAEPGGRRHTVTFTDDRSPQTASLTRLVQAVQQAGG